MEAFNDIFMDCTSLGTKIPKENYLVNGKHIVVDQGQNVIAGYTDLDDGLFEDVPAIIFGDHTRVIKYVDEPFFLGADGVKLLKSKKQDANYKYLYYALKNARIPDTGYNRHFKWLKEVSIEYPNIDRQQEIVEVLDKITKIIEERKLELLQLDGLIKAQFVEMFGDPLLNPKGWEQRKLKEIATGKLSYGSGASAIKYDGEYRYIRITDITDGGELNNDKKSPDSFDEKYVLNNGDILFARSGATVGKTFCYDEKKHGKAIFAGYLIRMVPDRNKVIPTYVFYYTQTGYYDSFIESAQRAVAQPNINAQEYGELVICVPPIELQEEFEAFVRQVDKSKVVVQKALEETQLLFDSLMQQYFR